MKKNILNKGDVVVCNFSPTFGHEQSGLRPALVISGSEFNEVSGLAWICPITSTKRGYYFEVELKTKKTQGVILAHHSKTIDFKARKVKVVDKVSNEILKEVVEKIKLIIE